MRNQCPDLIQHDTARHNSEKDQEGAHWNDVHRNHRQQGNSPDGRTDLASQPAAFEIALGRFAAKIRIDDQA